MNRKLCSLLWARIIGLLLGALATAHAPLSFGGESASNPALAVPRVRQLAPGVMTTIDTAQHRQLSETVARHDIIELLAVDPNFDWAKDVPFQHDIWCLEFKFKPVRMIRVDIPQPSGQMRQKLIWYMVYCVTNPGKVMHPVQDAELPYPTSDQPKLYQVKLVDEPVRFVPNFLLEGYRSAKEGEGPVLAYRDRVIPLAVAAIQQREAPPQRLLNTAEICQEIPVGKSLWGVATWDGVTPEAAIDPWIDRFAIYVKGLTNAYRWTDDPAVYQQSGQLGAGRRLVQKTLKINFWRPGDEYYEHEGEIRYGAPDHYVAPAAPERVFYEWVYR